MELSRSHRLSADPAATPGHGPLRHGTGLTGTGAERARGAPGSSSFCRGPCAGSGRWPPRRGLLVTEGLGPAGSAQPHTMPPASLQVDTALVPGSTASGLRRRPPTTFPLLPVPRLRPFLPDVCMPSSWAPPGGSVGVLAGASAGSSGRGAGATGPGRGHCTSGRLESVAGISLQVQGTVAQSE